MPSLNLPWHSFVTFPHVSPSVTMEKRPELPFPLPSSGIGKEQRGCFWASFSPDWTRQVSAPSSHRTCLSALLPALLPSSGCFQVPWHPFHTVKLRIVHSIPSEAAIVLNIAGEEPLFWLCCIPKHSLPSWLPGHTAGSCWMYCWPAPYLLLSNIHFLEYKLIPLVTSILQLHIGK